MTEPTDAGTDMDMGGEMDQGTHTSHARLKPCLLSCVVENVLTDAPQVLDACLGGTDQSPGVRAGLNDATIESIAPKKGDETDRNPSISEVAAEAPEPGKEDPLAKELAQRAESMFLGGVGAPRLSDSIVLVKSVDYLAIGIVKVAKSVVHNMNVASNPEVRKSWGEPLDEMEALAYLIGDAVGRMLVDTEARAIGRELERQLKAAKEESEKLRGNAAARRSKARKAAERDAAKEAGLAARLAAIDEDLAASRVALWARPLKKIAWPPKRSVIVPGPAPVHWRTKARAKAEESDEELPETGEDAEELAAQASLAAQAAEAAAEAALLKTQRSMKKLSRIPGSDRSDAEWIKYLTLARTPAEMQRRDAEYDRYEEAMRQVRVLATQGELAVAQAQAARKKADQLAGYAETMQALEAKFQLVGVRKAQQWSDARIRWLTLANGLTKACLSQLERSETRTRLYTDAERIWGPGWQSREQACGILV